MARIDRFSLLGALTLTLTPAVAVAQSGGPTRPSLDRGTAVARAGASVAGAEGAEWSLPGGCRVVAQPGAVLRVLHVPQPLQLGAGATVPGYTLIVKSGKVEVRVPPRAKSAVVVVAPRQLSAIVRTGVFRIAASPTQTALANAGGESTYSVAGGAFRALAPSFVYAAEGSSGAERPLVSPPRSIRGKRVLITSGPSAELGKLSWEPVEGAVGYRADLSKDGKALASIDTSGSTLERELPALAPGSYRLRISAYDASGIVSGQAAEVDVRVVGMELPAGAYTDSRGTVRLPRGQKVRFLGAEGLEMTYGGDRFVRAAETVGLYRNERTTVHLRIPGTYDFATARLEPRTVRARIEIGPRRAHWPKDPIVIRVRLEDPSGEPIPASIEAKPRVLVGVREIDVPFTAQGGWLRAVVKPQAGAGPWVVRVSVEDGAEQPLGYDFVEIAKAPPSRQAKLGLPARLETVSSR
ncbi:MAG: hypothetical protein HS104_13285 [Polyangiaceae bacterium]|nr:hypothetical protein [Polyangiaceae bacterium]MCE7890007.1 hypothetical protein [Sorangiineae bacterium PRO1]MCL4752312.1 hypothetical protein [Myxococcales bacterium]